jgi:glutamate-1-semialdehyde 2,1-aminomutase
MEILQRENVVNHMWVYGKKLMDGVNSISKEMGIEANFYMEGYPCSPNYIAKDRDNRISLEMRTLFAQEMIANGVMMPYVAISMSHDDAALNQTLEAVRKALSVYTMALDKGLSGYLQSPPINPVFRKFN